MAHCFAPSILRDYDIRGVVGRTLDTADALALGRSFGTMIRRAGGRSVAVGYDGRLTSPALEAALVAGLTASGVDVVRIGLGPSPMLYHAAATLEVDGGIQVTGSHNPGDHNGFKMLHHCRPVFGAAIRDLARTAEAGDWETGSGRITEAPVLDRYVRRVAAGCAGGLRIGWDAGNGAAGPAIEQLVKLLPGEHHLLFTDVDGNFPNHHPDPTEDANLAQLRALVVGKRLHFGVAFDGDGDRIGAVDGQGRVLRGDQILSILVEPVLRERPGAAIVADVKSSKALFDRIAALGGQPVMWKSGHSNIKAMMRELDAPIAGEMSGHIFFGGEWHCFDDALLAAVRLIDAVAASGTTLDALRDAMPPVVSTPELRFAVDPARKEAVVAEVIARLRAAGAAVDTTDGARVTTPDGWWLLRVSHTEDMLTARAEAHDEAALARVLAAIDAQLAPSGVARHAAPDTPH
ncbi:phosphoglucomutase/phosphomannomutase PgmG [Sphingomonas lycopersici]|uniref:Phosphomannomutase/phosphoglucomutase n=1 Tax=Sphingomonas lycopersici TaxID=2951807 RepID=A0AA41Z886_9SPHN|nr:phosphomannomutase/phosphoglucomutase [Sphingomonas lycopersici]MCW6531100.1 phosphomannomutase/phosphoglucomutase [Sphingomonas lycopersici]MCW6534659.1 phosphomannomutase/phosphoglucomutase [Sphingomonas lycopersici]